MNNRLFNNWIWIIFLFFIGKPILLSQTKTFYEKGYKVEMYGADYGFKFDEIFDIYQAENGYLWMTNYSHLARFDGHEFKFYRPEDKDRTNNGGDYLRGVTEDRDGNIWVSTIEKEIWQFNPNSEQFVKHVLGELNRKNQRRADIVTDSLGQIWLGGDNGLFKINPYRDSFEVRNFSIIHQKNIKVKNRRVISFKDDQEQIWVSSDGGDLIKMHTTKGIEKGEVMMSWKKAPWRFLLGITQYDKDHLLLFYNKKTKEEQNTLALFNINTYEITEIKTGLDKKKKFVHLEKDVVGNIWLGSIGNGLYVLKPPFIPVEEIGEPNIDYFNITQKSTIRGDKDFIFSLKLDNNGNLWVGTRMNFLYKIDTNQSGLSFIDFQQYGYQSEQEIRSLWNGKADNIWVSGFNGLIKLNPKTNDFTYFETANDFNFFEKKISGNPDLGTLFIFSEQEDTLYMGAGPNLVAYSKKDNVIVEKKIMGFPEKIKGLIMDYYELNEDSHFLSIGFPGSVPRSYLYDPKKQIINHTFKNLSTPLLTENSLWLGGVNEVFKYNIEKEQLDTFQSPHAVLTLFEDSKNNVWLGCDAGLGLINESTKTIQYYNESDGLLSTMVAEILEYKEYLWIFTFKGIFSFDPRKKQFNTYNQLDGIGKLRYAVETDAIVNEDGDIWILGEKGLYTFNPNNLIPDLQPPQINITKLKINKNKTIGILGSHSFHTSDFMEFPYFENNLSIDYIGIHLDYSKLNTYQYILEGHQSDWQNVGNERTARFFNLPLGNYTFKVKAANADGIWSEPKSIKITILPPWWQTWWAYLVYALSILGLLAYWYRTLQQKIKNKEAQLAKEKAFSSRLERINTANQRFVPNDFLQILGKESIEDLKLGDQTHTKMTVLFSDIRSYTTLSESMTPEENFKFINAYLGRVGPIIKEHSGFISSYLGDGFMALFVNEPKNAIAATIAMQKELDNYNQERLARGKKALRTGMGLNTGDLMLGVIGDEHRYESTVISDAVNTASRMEGLTKVFGAAIILSERTLQEVKVVATFKVATTLVPDFAYRYLGKVRVKGKDKALKIYDLYEGETIAIRELKAQTKVDFEQGIHHYFNRQFGKSAECFKQVLMVNEGDKAAQYYLDKSVEYIVNGVSENWSGVEEMVMK